MPDPSQHAQDRNWFESILRNLPGFKGYLEKEYRRESDYLARSWMADRLQHSKSGLDEYLRRLTDGGQLDDLPQVERVRTRLDGLISKIRSDVRGYSGVFDYVKVDEELLDKVYAHDHALMDQVAQLAASLEQLSIKDDTPSAVSHDLLRAIEDVEARFAVRGELLKGIAPEH